jgi:catechol 2,3-dioxygenase-like lactoylglutathione lyase family enzyme
MRIDHVVFATEDLDAAAARFEHELGLAVGPGGRHDGLGTHNRVAPLARGFVELLAVADDEEASRSDTGAALMAALCHGDGWLTWAVAVPDVGAVAAALGLSTTSVGRQGMVAHLAGVSEAMAEPGLPFFIERGDPRPLRDELPALAWVEVAGDGERLGRWLAGAELPVTIVDGTPGLRAVGIGDRELRTA